MSADKSDGVTQAPIFARAKDAAQQLGVSKSLLWLWVKTREGFPQPLRPSNRVTLFDVQAIKEHLKATAGAKS